MKTKGKNINNTLNPKNERIQCHFISNTHWDREWRYSAQRTRYMLGYMLDMLFDIFEKEPDFKYFHLDSQTMPIQDYLETYPEKAELVRKYVNEEKLIIGPWFCLPDEFCVGGESLIRNLLLGHKIAKKFGVVSKTGYSPFGWGQISQIPQIYLGFGIDVMSFYRGVNTYIAPRSEFIWESPDGSRIICSRLGVRPRYNIWYIIQRPVYWNEKDENNRVMSWKNGHGPFRFIDEEKSELDYQYIHPRFEYFEENIPERAEQAISEQNNDWTTPHRFWSAGHDSSCPDIREARMIADCDKALGDKADVFHSTIKAFQEGIKANAREDWPIVKGEMRYPRTKKSDSALMGWVSSARTYIKQDNFKTERDIICYAEPMAVFASLLGAPYPQNFIDLSYNWLLQNHGHDSIGACGRDIIYDDVIYRSRQSREISNCLIERAMMYIAGDIKLSGWTSDMMALVVYNPAPFMRSEVINAVIEIPIEWNCKDFEIFDNNGEKVVVQVCDKKPFYQVVQNPNDVANTFPSTRYYIRGEFKNIPGMGYKTFSVKPIKNPRNSTPITMCKSINTMENEFIAVTINPNGSYDIYNKMQNKVFKGLGYFRDTGETGNPWEHIPPPNDILYTTLGEKAEISLVQDGELEASFKAKILWALPEGRFGEEKTRSSLFKPYEIVNTLTLRKGQKWVEVVTEVDNSVEDHYLQVSFMTGIITDKVFAQGQFDVVERSIEKLDYSEFEELPMTEHPMNSFVDLSDGKTGIAFLNEGLKAYEVHNDRDNTISLTLLRCFPLRICVTQDMLDYSKVDKGSQCPGKHKFRYAVMPHAGDWAKGKVWQASERFNLAFHAAQFGPTKYGCEPLTKSFLELRPECLHVSAIKRSESGEGWVVRLFNPYYTTIKGSIRLNEGFSGPQNVQSPVERIQAEFALPVDKYNNWSKIRLVTLEEVPLTDLRIEDQGWVEFEITSKKILTFEFLP